MHRDSNICRMQSNLPLRVVGLALLLTFEAREDRPNLIYSVAGFQGGHLYDPLDLFPSLTCVTLSF